MHHTAHALIRLNLQCTSLPPHTAQDVEQSLKSMITCHERKPSLKTLQ